MGLYAASRTSPHFCQAPNLQSERWSRLSEHLSLNIIENLLCLGFISIYLWFCYVIFTRSILRTPACDILLYVRLKTTCAAIKLRKRLLTISKINLTR